MSLFEILFLLIILIMQLEASKQTNRVAVCITGQVNRIVPDQLYHGLIEKNSDFFFKFFFSLQFDPKAIHTMRTKYQMPSKFENVSQDYVKDNLKSAVTAPNSEFISVKFGSFKNYSMWMHAFNKTHLGRRFSQFRDSVHIMLNMYDRHTQCRNMVLEYAGLMEQKPEELFSYLLWTREDAFFFRPLDLSSLFNYFRDSSANSRCGILTKACLGWGGMSMRIHILRIMDGLKFLNKLDHYDYIDRNNLVFRNPELFEEHIAKKLGLRVCNLSIEELPVVAARHSYIDMKPCFLHQELKTYEKTSKPCIPEDFMDFGITRLCPYQSDRYQFIPWQKSPFIPNARFPKPKPEQT
jgi:hypothetical protein